MKLRLFNFFAGMSLLLCGCGTSPPSCVPAISLRSISEVDWNNVREDYTDDHFCERRIQLPTWAIKVAGGQVEIFEHTFRADYDVNLWIFADYYHEQTFLYLVEFQNQRYVFEVVSSRSPVDALDLPSIGAIADALRHGSLGRPLNAGDANKTFVDWIFYDEVSEKGVKLPATFIRLEAREPDLVSRL